MSLDGRKGPCFESRSMPRRAATPAPGSPVRGSRTGRPIMALLDLLGRRWVLRVVWELRDRELKFRELQVACDGVSASVLNERLHELREAGILETVEQTGYRLTTRGRSLLLSLRSLDAWAKEWAPR